MTGHTDEPDEIYYEQLWQTQLTYEHQTRTHLDKQQQREKVHLHNNMINSGEWTQLATRHETERRLMSQQHRAMRIALRKTQPR